jgi:uncharacterized C2H2 Zn-finger protein
MTPQNNQDEPQLLPGFHFSTTDESVDVLEFHRLAAQMLSGDSSKEMFVQSVIEEDSSIRQRHLHCDLGKNPSGRYCCSCGKSYTTSFRLGEHVQQCAGVTNHPCLACDKVFSTELKLSQHVAARHNDDKEACPECGDMFRADFLPKHLASGLGGCEGMLQASQLPEIDEAYLDESVGPTKSQYYWIYEGDYSWNKEPANRCDSGCEFEDFDFGFNNNTQVDQTMAYVKTLLQRPVSELPQESCDLCGDVFRAGSEELAQHIGQHSMDFTQKRHKCDECDIFFANEKDLDRHLQSADLNQHCGFTFRHSASSCTGHHPPTYPQVIDHALMNKHLWAWERCQFRTLRVTVARALADQVNQTAWPHMTLQDCRQTYVSLLPHYNIAGKDSPLLDDADFSAIDGHFSRLITENFPVINDYEMDDDATVRPDSTILSKPHRESKLGKTRSIVDMAALQTVFNMQTVFNRVKNGHKRHAFGGSLPPSFLRQVEAAEEGSRPNSVPSSGWRTSMMVKMTA